MNPPGVRGLARWWRILVAGLVLVILTPVLYRYLRDSAAKGSIRSQLRDPSHAAYVGTWRGDGTTLVIAPTGHFDDTSSNAVGTGHWGGTIMDFSGNDFTVDTSPWPQTFHVTQPPTRGADGTWTMTVDGKVLKRSGTNE